MLTTIAILTGLSFAAIYPLCFWISFDDPLKNNFHKFHLGLSNFIGGLAVVGLFFIPAVSLNVKILAVFWKLFFLGTSQFFWRKETVHPLWILTVALIGMVVCGSVQTQLITAGLMSVPVTILGGMVLCACIYAMNLGHWYLNVHGLSLHHLVRAVYVFWILAGLRLLWDCFMLATATVIYSGDSVSLLMFIQSMDGIFLLVGIIFGTLLPVLLLWFVRGTLLVKSTQSATGILYVILIAVFMGDLAYKYYLVKYGIVL